METNKEVQLLREVRKKFIYDGIDLTKEYGLQIVDIEHNPETLYGINQSLNFSGNHYVSSTQNRFSFNIYLCKYNQHELQEITLEEWKEYSRILFQGDYNTIDLLDGRLMYVKPINATRKRIGSSGYMSVEFESLSPYLYTHVIYSNHQVKSEKTVMIENVGVKKVNLTVSVKSAYQTIITNLNNGASVICQGNCKLIGDHMEMLGDVTGDISTLVLDVGENHLRIESISSQIRFEHQAEFIIG